MQETDKVSILAVDDLPEKLLVIESILSELGENILTASSATEALDCLLRTEIAVVLVDVCMPDLDGYEVIELLRARADLAHQQLGRQLQKRVDDRFGHQAPA